MITASMATVVANNLKKSIRFGGLLSMTVSRGYKSLYLYGRTKEDKVVSCTFDYDDKRCKVKLTQPTNMQGLPPLSSGTRKTGPLTMPYKYAWMTVEEAIALMEANFFSPAAYATFKAY